MKHSCLLGVILLGIGINSLLGATACPGQDAPPTTANGDQSVAQQPDHPALQRRNPRYKLRVGDSFDLTFPLTPEFNQVGSQSNAAGTVSGSVGGVIIQPDGYISLAGLGDVYAAGKTIPELTESIQTAYSKILHDPVVNVTLKDFERPYFMALGQVGKPGKYDLRGETTLTQGVALAGGFSSKGAKTSQVLLFRQVSEDWVEVRKIDVKKMLNGKDLREDVHLRPGDMIYVPTSLYSKIEPYIPKANLGLYIPMQ